MQTYLVHTFGCQMNKHDAERVSGLLATSGFVEAPDDASADVIVFMTCCVREKADERLVGQVASLKAIKARRPDALIAVGGCIGQRDGEKLLEALPHVDVVFGTHNLSHLPELLARAARERRSVVEVLESTTDFTTDLPGEREHAWHAWVPIMVGCDNFCSYCIVPYVRGRERSRRLEDVVAECRSLAADGVLEVTLLGQNVNSYGRDLYGEPLFAGVLEAVAQTGIDRVRFATSHPKDLSDATIRAMSEIGQVMPALHLPVQSGSNSVLRAMNRRYTREQYLSLVGRLYDAIPDLALSTDIIVGFPGESDADFEDTLDLVRQAAYDQAFTFIYSPREGTPAAARATQAVADGAQLAHEVVQERFDRLVELVQHSALQKNLPLVGTVQRVLFEGPSKRDPGVLAGRSEGNKVVHVAVPHGNIARDFAGTFADVRITRAQTWFLSGELAGTNEA
jgi:tRNA-2-methylthio-N6-dimethylallyladenosine synthase